MKSYTLAVRGFFLAFLILAATSSCARSEAMKLTLASERFHSLFKESKFRDIYREASPFLRSRKSEEEFISQLRTVQMLVGEIQSVERNTTPLPPPVAGTPENERWTVYNVKGMKGECSEYIAWFLENDEPKLAWYDCSPEPGTSPEFKVKQPYVPTT